MRGEGRDLRAELEEQLPEPSRQALGRAVALAERRRLTLYLVGGAVRDLLLGVPHVDVDLVVEGDAIRFASVLGGPLRARVVKHVRFGTAAVQGSGFRLDFAAARSERYERPGALPTVRPGSLADDLARRDFSINAMALALTGLRAGELLDPLAGQTDLTARRVRVLHDDSFRNDATRILRAVRYAGRLDFRLERHTEALLRRDIAFLDTISDARLRHEVERVAAESGVSHIVRLAQSLGVLAAVHPALAGDKEVLKAAAELGELPASHRDAALLCLLVLDAPREGIAGVIARLALTRRQADALRSFVSLRERERTLAGASLRPSAAVRALETEALPAIEAFALVTREPLAAERARRYVDEWRSIRPRLNGRDLARLGVPQGPGAGAAMALLKEARLDGRTQSKEDEELLIERIVREQPAAEARRG